MAKRGRKPKAAQSMSANGAGQESISGYFRSVFKANPKLLKTRSNDQILEQWLTDHPGESAVPKRVKDSLANVKSLMRKKLRRRGRKPASEQAPAEAKMQTITIAEPGDTSGEGLELLEIQIDDCLTLAKNIDREGLETVIGFLRRARNGVVWKTGQS